MPILSGSVLFDRTRTAAPPGSMVGIANVPVVLQNRANGDMLSVLTDTNGNFTFLNVPIGDYRLVESYRMTGVTSPGDFTAAIPGQPVPNGVVPPISYVQDPPVGATNLDCTIPNTLLFNVSGDMSNLYICNGPVRYIPIGSITDPCTTIDPINIIEAAEWGTMGAFPQGTPANTGAVTEPYPSNVPDFEYVWPLAPPADHSPEDGEYTVQNIMNADAANNVSWWRIADHTFGNETGRMMVVNGYEPGSVFFTESVTVKPYTYYLFSTWILNMLKITGQANPQLGVRILDGNGQVIFAQTLGALIPLNQVMPEWRQIGTAIYTAEYTDITVQFLSEGPATWGNDYAIDDIALQEIRIPVFTPHKECTTSRLAVGETATFTIELPNNCQSPLTNVTFQDSISEGLALVPNSVTINSTSVPGADPEIGFSVPDIPGGGRAVITFQVIAMFVPEVNPVTNVANMNYEYTPIQDGIPGAFDVNSNIVRIRINPPYCEFLFAALQRERIVSDDISGIMEFDTPLFTKGAIFYQPNGTIDISLQGTYIVAWFASGMHGFAKNGQSYKLKKYNYETSVWNDIVGASNHIKVSSTTGFAVVEVSGEDISEYQKATIALFNCADANIRLTLFNPKAGIMVYGANFLCTGNRMTTIKNNLLDISDSLLEVERFLYLSDVVTIMSETPDLAGLGVAVIYLGFSYNFWGVGTLDDPQVLDAGVTYYLARSEQFAPLSFYQGDPTIGTLWIKTPGGSFSKMPLQLDDTGIYITPSSPLTLAAGTKFSFTQSLILVDDEHALHS